MQRCGVRWSVALEASRDGGGILAAVENTPDLNVFAFDAVVDRLRKPPRQRAVVAEYLLVDACVQQQ